MGKFWSDVGWAKSVRKRGRFGDGGITHIPPPQKPLIPPTPPLPQTYPQSASEAVGEGESAYAHKGLPCYTSGGRCPKKNLIYFAENY